MRRTLLASILALAAATGCGASDPGAFADPVAADGKADGLRGATDARAPELGKDVSIVRQSKVALGDAVRTFQKSNGPIIEAKFELADDGHSLSLSLYPAKNGLSVDAERNVFQELSGDPTATPFAPGLDTFHDFEHLTRSSRDLTLTQLSAITLPQAIDVASRYGQVYWTIPTIRHGRAGYGIYFLSPRGTNYYAFLDGAGDYDSDVVELPDGPGAGATDQRAPELGSDFTIVRQSRIRLLDAVRRAQKSNGDVIEAKFELADDGKSLSLSIYPVGKTLAMDAERNTFGELSGDPTAAQWKPDFAQFDVPDEEHVTRSARDLTLAQTAGVGITDAIAIAEDQVDDGFAFWAIPTIRGTRAGWGVYVLDGDDQVHYLFVS